MIEFLKLKLKEKKVLILGFGREGQSTFNLLRNIIPDLNLGISDKNPEIEQHELLSSFNKGKLYCGNNYLNAFSDYNFIIKSPGVVLADLQISENVELSSQTSLFIEFYRNQIIGITGTKGKSTTSSLIHYLFTNSGMKSVLLGNIGKPAFDSILEIDKETKIVFELSAHQLEFVEVSPHIAVLLNIFPEHLDYFKSLKKYEDAKININRFQSKDDILICSSQLINKLSTMANTVCFGFEDICDAHFYEGNLVFEQDGKTELFNTENISLPGKHNQLNVMAAVLAARAAGLSFSDSFKVVGGFKGLAHRLEFVGICAGIKFYNDSISTVPQSTIEAIKSLGNIDTIILGGFDRGLDYSSLASFLNASEIKNFILLGKAGDEILKQMQHYSEKDKQLFKVDNMQAAFEIIKEKTAKNGICLLSPAAASYDQFKNFEHRGELFVELARKL